MVTFMVRIINTVDDTSNPSPIPSEIRQFMRILLNTTAAICVLYFETYITFAINKAAAGVQGRSVPEAYKRHIFALSAYISLIFLTQALLQFLRLVKATSFAPFYGLGWSLVLKRIVEFKEEYSDNLRGHASSNLVPVRLTDSAKFQASGSLAVERTSGAIVAQ